MTNDTAAEFRRDLLEWAQEHTRSFPWRESEASLYEVFMAEMFLRRTRSDVVETFLPDFLEAYPDMQSLQAAEKETLASIIRPMGLQNRRAKALIALAQELDGGSVPTDPDALQSLPQVGPYVANATLCFALDHQLPIIDRNVDRIYRRLFGARWKNLTETEQWAFADRMLPEGEGRLFNLALLDFASIICTAPEPNCEECFATDYCTYYQDEIASTEN